MTVHRILLIDFPFPAKVRNSYRFTSNLVTILQSLTNDLWVISDNVDERFMAQSDRLIRIGLIPHFLHEIKPRFLSMILWALKSFLIQAKIIAVLWKLRNQFDTVIIFMMHPTTEIIPLLFAKILRKKIVKVPLGIAPPDKIYAPILWTLFEQLSLFLADYYVPEYQSTIGQVEEYHHIKHPERLLPDAPFLILDEDFIVMRKIQDREIVVGYFGGLREIKGILNFVEAIPIVLQKDGEVKFIIAGEGVLRDRVASIIEDYKSNRVQLCNWIPHEALLHSLNTVKFVIIPSYSETGPFLGIEAMACGTIVLSTRVGIMKYIIEDGINGFILENNSPEHIADRILELLNRDDSSLQRIVAEARIAVEREFTLPSAVKKWRGVLLKISESK